jgi:hypothetical protein
MNWKQALLMTCALFQSLYCNAQESNFLPVIRSANLDKSDIELPKYTISFFGINSIPNVSWEPVKINDNGQICGTCIFDEKLFIDCEPTIFVADKNGITLIELPGFDRIEEYFPRAINNSGQVLGETEDLGLFLWDREQGVQFLNFASNGCCGLNDKGEAFGSDYVWKSGNERDTSQINQQINELGYGEVDVTITCLNNWGEVAGIFSSSSWPYQTHPFFWDGEKIHVIPFKNFPSNGFFKLSLNDKGIVLVSKCHTERSFLEDKATAKTILWNKELGVIKEIQDFQGTKITSYCTILGYKVDDNEFLPAIWKNDEILEIDELTKSNFGMNIFDLFPLDDVKDINDKEQILCQCWCHGILQPCILDPVEN